MNPFSRFVLAGLASVLLPAAVHAQCVGVGTATSMSCDCCDAACIGGKAELPLTVGTPCGIKIGTTVPLRTGETDTLRFSYQPTAAWLLVGNRRADLQIAPDLRINIAPIVAVPLLQHGDSYGLDLPVPNDPLMVGAVFAFQSIVRTDDPDLDTPFAASRGVLVEIKS